jgi:hypothetical protein
MFKKLFLILIFTLVGITAIASVSASSLVVVTPDNMQGWAFVQEVPNGTGSLVNGPSVPPLGSGSAFMTLDATGRMLLLTQAYAGTRLDAITALQYSTYKTAGSGPWAISLQFDIDTNLTDGNTAWQGRLTYEPYYTQPIVDGVWQTWNPLTSGANWWFSGAPGNAVCSIGSPCTWAQVIAAFPNAGLRAGVGMLNLKAGGPWSGFQGAVDALTVGVNGADTTFDFEAAPPLIGPPTSKDQCKNGGWATFNNPTFRNQGNCVSFVNQNS